MIKITPLASGSSGNSFLIRNRDASILIDAGLSGKQIVERLDNVGMDPGSLKGILVSHAHVDHVKGVGVLSRKFKIPVFINNKTFKVAEKALGKLHRRETFETGRAFDFAGFRIHPFSVPHDCADPVGFRISNGSASLGIATDLGVATGLVANLLTGLNAVVLESNHDPVMLRDGPYPWELKQRIRSRLGHLSNEQSAELLERIVSDELRVIILAHMSETNNTEELAEQRARESLQAFLAQEGAIFCAVQHQVGPTVEL
ncbi:MAG: MBL fold metallo-hydrolase [Deltaproteobacteria bacterium]|nr:MBL fold metallo-hydrolase [Deltaproteobacteria bacterium]